MKTVNTNNLPEGISKKIAHATIAIAVYLAMSLIVIFMILAFSIVDLTLIIVSFMKTDMLTLAAALTIVVIIIAVSIWLYVDYKETMFFYKCIKNFKLEDEKPEKEQRDIDL